MGNYTLKIKKSDAVATIVFLLSFFHQALLLLLLAFFLCRAWMKTEDAVRGLVLIAIRTILNPRVAVDIGTVQLVKWLVIFAISFIILLKTQHKEKPLKLKQSANMVMLFCFVVCLFSLVNSSYPIVSIFKCFSYGFVFLGILMGVWETSSDVDWADVLYRYLTLLMLCSLILSPFSLAYFSQKRWFMGAANHSQMFGIMAALYLSLLLLRMIKGDRSAFQYFMLIAVTYLTFRSGSRTGMISALLCILYAVYVEIVKKRNIYILFILLFAGVFIWVVCRDEVSALFRDFILKHDDGTSGLGVTLEKVTMSRKEQYESYLRKYQNNPWIGSGFMVPYVEGVRDWSFSTSLLVENGNLIYSVLGDLGIIGFILFVITYGSIYLLGSKKRGRSLLFLAPLLINMGEMVFFSTNNNAIVLYVMIAAFLA